MKVKTKRMMLEEEFEGKRKLRRGEQKSGKKVKREGDVRGGGGGG